MRSDRRLMLRRSRHFWGEELENGVFYVGIRMGSFNAIFLAILCVLHPDSLCFSFFRYSSSVRRSSLERIVARISVFVFTDSCYIAAY